MSEDIDSRRDDSGATAPAPRVAVEPTPQAPAGQAQPGPEAATPGAATQVVIPFGGFCRRPDADRGAHGGKDQDQEAAGVPVLLGGHGCGRCLGRGAYHDGRA